MIKEQPTKEHKCGCITVKDGNVWIFQSYCKAHKPNYQRRTDKIVHKREVQEKRNKFLKYERRKK